MHRRISLLFPLLAACELLIPALGPDSCENEGEVLCEGNVLIACAQGVLIRQDCGAAGCDPGRGVCQTCGDGTLLPPEECDDNNPASGDGCSAICLIEDAAVCGNATLEAGEGCDDGNTTEGDGCDAQCVPETCGDGAIQEPEQCDGANLGGQSCESLGFLRGELACKKNCRVDTDGCVPFEVCTSGVDEDQDALIDCADPDCAVACLDACNEPTEILEDIPTSGTNAGQSDNNFVNQCDSFALGGNAPEVAFQFTAPATASFLISLVPEEVDMGFYVRRVCNDPNTQVDCADSVADGQPESIDLSAAQGETFFILVDGFSGAIGNFTLLITRL